MFFKIRKNRNKFSEFWEKSAKYLKVSINLQKILKKFNTLRNLWKFRKNIKNFDEEIGF